MKKVLRLVRMPAHEAYVLGVGKIAAPDGFHANDWPEDRFFTVAEAVDWFKVQIEGGRVAAIKVELDDGDRELPSEWSRRVARQKTAKCRRCGGRGVLRPADSFEASGELTPCPDCTGSALRPLK